MLTSQDLEMLSRMVKNELEKLVLKRASESASEQDKSSFNEDIDRYYILLARLIIQAESSFAETLPKVSKDSERLAGFANDIQSQQDLARKLVGTCWRKKNGVEVVIFREAPTFDYFHTQETGWSSHEYILGDQIENMTLYWKMDNFEAACEFADGFVTFTEVNNPNLTWTLEWMP